MGCFNSSGFISKLPIRAGDRVVCFIALTNLECSGNELYNPNSLVSPLFLPIRGNYDDYGSVDCIDKTNIVKLFEKYSGVDIESLLRSVERCLYGKTVDDNIKYWKERKDEVGKYKTLKQFLKLTSFYGENEKFAPVLMMEHEEIYDKITEQPVTSGWFINGDCKSRYSTFMSIINDVKNVFSTFSKIIEERNLGPVIGNMVLSPTQDCDRMSTYLMLHELDKDGDEEDEEMNNLYDQIKTISEKGNSFYRLIGGEGSYNLLRMFRLIDYQEKLDVYEQDEEEFRRFYNLWCVFARAPMYFNFSQCAGMQGFDYKLFVKVYDVCYNFLLKEKEEYDRNYGEEDNNE